MFACDCWFFRTHQEGVTAKELAAITGRAKSLTVTPISDSVEVRLFLVKGGDEPHYVTMYPGDDDGRNCKHIIAARSFIEETNEQTPDIQKVIPIEDGGETEPPEFFGGVSAVG